MWNMRLEGHWFEDPKMTNPKQGEKCITYFMYFLLVNFFKDVIHKETNKEIISRKGGEITWGDFMRFVGLRILMSTVVIGCNRSS